MDPLSAVAIVSSLFTFSASSLLLVQNFIKSASTLKRVQREIAVLQHILEECHEIVTVQNHPTSLPKSVQTVLLLCHDHQANLLQILGKILCRKRRLEIMIRLTIRDDELMSSYHSFRDSVLLLRDLSSE